MGVSLSLGLVGFFFMGQKENALDEAHGKEDAVEVLPNPSRALFAGGCFWCMESAFEALPGVKSVVSGYTGGNIENPTYEEVSSGSTGHIESILVLFDEQKLSYKELLDFFWRNVNPTDAEGQFVDRGFQYTTAIFVYDEQQRQEALASKKHLEESKRYDKPIVTPILSAKTFYPAEDYHQDYYKKNPIRYKLFRYNSGRDKYLNKIWSKTKKK